MNLPIYIQINANNFLFLFQAEIASGCQILVTTPPYLNRLLEKYDIVLISFNKLQFLVLDKADLVLEKYYDAVS